MMMAWKLGPALACGNSIILKPSEFTPPTSIKMCHLINEAGSPPGVVNVLAGYGHTTGHAISSHMKIEKVAFTGSTLVGRKIWRQQRRATSRTSLSSSAERAPASSMTMQTSTRLWARLRVVSCAYFSCSHANYNLYTHGDMKL